MSIWEINNELWPARFKHPHVVLTANDRLPHAVLIGDSGTVLSKGLVNSREHLESLVTAHELGVVSVQDYLANSKTKVA